MTIRDGDYWSGLAQDQAEARQVQRVIASLAAEVCQQTPDMGNVRGMVAELEDRLLVQSVASDGAPF